MANGNGKGPYKDVTADKRGGDNDQMIFEFMGQNSPQKTKINNGGIEHQLVKITEEGDDSMRKRMRKLRRKEKKKPEATPAHTIPSL